MKRVGPAVLVAMAMALGVPRATAQEPEKEPIGRFAADVRIALPRFPDDASAATALGVTTEHLPSHGLGLAAGLNFYPARLGKVTLGIGGEWLVFSRGTKTLDAETDGTASGPAVTTEFSVLSPQISLNFGSRNGWSYLSGGIGWAAFTTELKELPVADSDGTRGPSTMAAARGGSRRSTSPLRSTCASTRSMRRMPRLDDLRKVADA